MKDYYELLGVAKSASAAEIKSAYRKKALEWHPDRNKAKDAEEMFKKINKAYEVLSDAQKKQVYDQVGHAAYESRGGGAGGPAGGGYGPAGGAYSSGADYGFNVDFNMNDPFDIFEQFFGGASPFGGRGQAKRRQIYAVNLTFNEAVKGVSKEFVIQGKNKKVTIPAGVDSGTRIRFEEFDIQVQVAAHAYFKREDQNIILEKKISFPLAALGGTISVETIGDPVTLKIRPGTQNGAVVRLKDKGIPFPNSNRKGDMYVVYKIDVPEKLSSKAKKLIEDLKKEL